MEKIREQFAIYSRKSKFTGKGESIGNQIELCRQYISAHYGSDFAQQAYVYEDEGFSGGNLDRPQFKKMMQEAKQDKFTAIVCYRLDRISRNIGDFANLIEDLNQMHISFISIKEQFDTSSPMGRAMMYIASVFSQLERETIAERIRDNMHELSKSGRWLGGNTPTGYQSEGISTIKEDGKVKKAYQLRLLPEEAKLVRLIYEKFLETGSLTRTETYLIQTGYKTKYNRLFSRFAIKAILTNPVYMIADMEAYQYLKNKKVDLFSDKEEFNGTNGIMAYNRTLQKPGKAHEKKEMDEWIVAIGGHEGLISGAMWVKVQNMLERNKSKNYRKPRSNVALMSGLLYCGACGDYMRPKLSDRLNLDGDQIYSYLCTMKERSRMKCCTMKNPNGNTLDKMVIEEIKKLSVDKEELRIQMDRNKRLLEEGRRESEEDIRRMQEESILLGEEIAGLVASLKKAGGTTAEEYIVAQIEELHQKKEDNAILISEVRLSLINNELSDVEAERIKETLSSFPDTIDSMNVEEKRMAVRSFIKKAVWDGRCVHLYFLNTEEPSGESSK
ncbi:recombinase family protein [Lacrimispora algidixylanolytica]|uniref:Resolvase n=1 Tax=Lacrimispora algidixylanolytica TaxID=94868 RepID=A0A419SSI2_9FIRM|nr:recombinase family protein [Lacrimispora algidixylanolytica]RKD28168.1 resolvase [Lacrimispora algidixylanolytica]